MHVGSKQRRELSPIQLIHLGRDGSVLNIPYHIDLSEYILLRDTMAATGGLPALALTGKDLLESRLLSLCMNAECRTT